MKIKDCVLVYGSNLLGINGAGAALTAKRLFGAKNGKGAGLQSGGRSYAIPTKETPRMTLPLKEIARHVHNFLVFARYYKDHTFFVTRIGCGLAGYSDADIGPMFAGAAQNCILPIMWKEYRPIGPTHSIDNIEELLDVHIPCRPS